MIELLQNPPKFRGFTGETAVTLLRDEASRVTEAVKVIRCVTPSLRLYSERQVGGVVTQFGLREIITLSSVHPDTILWTEGAGLVLPKWRDETTPPLRIKRFEQPKIPLASVTQYMLGTVDDENEAFDFRHLGSDRKPLVAKLVVGLPAEASRETVPLVVNRSGFTATQVVRLGLLAGVATVEAVRSWEDAKAAYCSYESTTPTDIFAFLLRSEPSVEL